jgi:ABC-type dipeptide/oligopeptide/nickel transport system permease component
MLRFAKQNRPAASARSWRRLPRHHPVLWHVLRRLVALLPQLFGVSVVTFMLIRLLPGNPAELLLGPLRTQGAAAKLTHTLGLDRPLPEQYWSYLKRLAHGDLGFSFFTGNAVSRDLLSRTPATLELLSYAMLLAVVVGVSIGAISAARGNRGAFVRISGLYGRLAGAFPDFWVSLVAIYFFFFKLRWFPAPLGRLGLATAPPRHITGFYTFDSLVTGNFATFSDALAHLALPVLVLGLIVAPTIAKTTNAAMSDALRSDYIRYGRACGMKPFCLYRYALRNAAPPVVTIFGILLVYLLGGAVLIEKVFAWGGVGLYAVQAVVNSDYFAVQGFVLVATTFTMLVYLIIDLIHMALEPRIRL